MIKTYYHSYFAKPDSNVRLVSVRAGNVIGGGDWAASRIVPDCVRAWSNGEAVEIRSPQATRPWQHVLEPLSGYLRVGQFLAEQPKLNGEPYNFGPNADQNHTVLEILEEIAKGWDFGKQEEKLRVFPNPNFHEAGLLKLCCDKALHDLAWKPTLGFRQTGDFTIAWYNNFYNHKEVNIFDFTQQQINAFCQVAKDREIAWATN